MIICNRTPSHKPEIRTSDANIYFIPGPFIASVQNDRNNLLLMCLCKIKNKNDLLKLIFLKFYDPQFLSI